MGTGWGGVVGAAAGGGDGVGGVGAWVSPPGREQASGQDGSSGRDHAGWERWCPGAAHTRACHGRFPPSPSCSRHCTTPPWGREATGPRGPPLICRLMPTPPTPSLLPAGLSHPVSPRRLPGRRLCCHLPTTRRRGGHGALRAEGAGEEGTGLDKPGLGSCCESLGKLLSVSGPRFLSTDGVTQRPRPRTAALRV